MEYLEDKCNELAMTSKNKNIGDLYRGINEHKRGLILGVCILLCVCVRSGDGGFYIRLRNVNNPNSKERKP
jgi:hypothetical protein